MLQVDIALSSILTGGTALTALLSGTAAVYNAQAPQGAAYPFVVFNQQAGGDDNLTQTRMKTYVYQIASFSKTSQAAAWAMDAAVDTLLNGVTLSVTGWTNFWTAKEQELPIIENLSNGEMVYSVRSLYRIRLGV